MTNSSATEERDWLMAVDGRRPSMCVLKGRGRVAVITGE